jgi:hypothetical protein
MNKNQEKKDPLEMILDGEKIEKEFPTKRGKFTMALPLPRDIREIEVEVALKLEGNPITSFSNQTVASFRAYATLDRVIVKAPEWWDNLESSEECPDDALITELYGSYLRLYSNSQKEISKSRYKGKSEVGKARTKTKNVDNGAFSDITNRSEDEGS